MRFIVIILIFWNFASCKIHTEKSPVLSTAPAQNFAIVEMAYKANLMEYPGVYARKYIIAKLDKDDIIKDRKSVV